MSTIESSDRRSRKRERNRRAILDAAHRVMAVKGIDAATMAEISEEADVGLGSLYNHFSSKDELAVAVMDLEIDDLARLIEAETDHFADPAQVFAYGIRTVITHAMTNDRWRELLARPDVVADRFRLGFGPYAIRDILIAADAGRFTVANADIAWNLAVWAVVGTSESICRGGFDPNTLEDAVIGILGIVGLTPADAKQVTQSLPVVNTGNQKGKKK